MVTSIKLIESIMYLDWRKNHYYKKFFFFFAEINDKKNTTVKLDDCEKNVIVSSFVVGSVVDNNIDWNDENFNEIFQKAYKETL